MFLRTSGNGPAGAVNTKGEEIYRKVKKVKEKGKKKKKPQRTFGSPSRTKRTFLVSNVYVVHGGTRSFRNKSFLDSV
jgi:hypothetical protein